MKETSAGLAGMLLSIYNYNHARSNRGLVIQVTF